MLLDGYAAENCRGKRAGGASNADDAARYGLRQVLDSAAATARIIHEELVRCVHPEDMEIVGKSLEGAIAAEVANQRVNITMDT